MSLDFAWVGTDVRGREQKGTCSAAGLSEAASQLRATGISPVSIDRIETETPRTLQVTADSFSLFNRNLAEMAGIGMALPAAVREISMSLRAGRFKSALERVEAGLREGKPLEEAMAESPHAFPAYYRKMIRAGTAAGNLPAVLSAVARNGEAVRFARRAFIEAISYPALILLIAAVFVVCFLSFFMPQYRELCELYRIPAPITMAVVSKVLSSTGWMAALVAGTLAAIAATVYFLHRTIGGERFLRRIPLVGRIRTHLSMARLFGALGVLLQSNSTLDRALPVALGAAGSLELESAADAVAARAVEGRGLGEVLAGAPGVPAELAAYLSVSERTGNAGRAAAQMADLLTEQALSESEALFVVLVPLSLAVAGIVIGTLLVSIVAPYMKFVEEFGR